MFNKKNISMKKIMFLLMLGFTLQASAQIKEVTIQASGLTCSMCSKSIYKSLTAVAFVQEVKSDIKNSAFVISFKDSMQVDLDVLQKAVTNAGFSVASCKAVVSFTNQPIKNDAHIEQGGKTWHFLNVQSQTLNGTKTVVLVDKNFVTTKEFKKYSKFTTMKCYETGVMESCCTKLNSNAGKRIYHVTII